MKKPVTLFLLILFYVNSYSFAQQTQTQPSRREIGSLVIEGIPEIPQRIVDRINQYQNTRSALLRDWEPSGKGVLVATRFGETSQLHFVSAPSGYRRQITFFREPVSSARYAHHKDLDGFVFSMDEGGGEFFQLYWYDLKTGNYKMLTDGGKTQNQAWVWSNSGDKAAFSSTKRNGKDYDLYVMNGVDPATARLAKELQGSWTPVDWSEDDSLILLSHYISINESYLFVFNPSTGEMTEINPTGGAKKIHYETAKFARGRKGVYYTSDEDSEVLRLTYFDLETKSKEILTPRARWDVEEIAVSLDGKWLAFSTNESGISRLYLAPASEPQKTQIVELPKGVIGGLLFDRQNSRLGFTMTTPQSPADVFVVDLGTKKLERWTFSEVGGLNPDTFVSPELIHYPTFDTVTGAPIDPNVEKKPASRMISAFYYKPRDESKKPYPVIIDIHGGPESQSVASFDPYTQHWVNELGAAVLVPNVRGSSGYGKSFLLLDDGVKREDSVKDIGKLLDWIATRPELDAKRVAVFGGSYGGYMVLASMIHFSDRIKCGVDFVGISNFVTFLESTEKYRRDLRRVEYGDESDPKMREFLNSISPTTNAEKIKVPLFVAQGQNDPRVPVTEAEQMVKQVSANGGSVWYVLAKDEGHGFKKKTNRDYFRNAVTLFFEEYLIGDR